VCRLSGDCFESTGFFCLLSRASGIFAIKKIKPASSVNKPAVKKALNSHATKTKMRFHQFEFMEHFGQHTLK
jgi:hypothetical protein